MNDKKIILNLAAEELLKKITGTKKTAIIGVIGLGYVGLPLAVAFAARGFTVYGFDVDKTKIKKLIDGQNYILDCKDSEVKELVKNKRLIPIDDPKKLKLADCISICVPTPLSKSRQPDVMYIRRALDTVKENFKQGSLIVLESTTYPGTTEELMLPQIANGKYEVGKDFFLAFSPERVDPGNPKYKTENTPKIIGGITAACGMIAKTLYEQVIKTVIQVSSPKVAELVKLHENTFRNINIGLANELAQLCHMLDIDVWEVIDAASTKPFGFMPFYPGPGLGGHCIPIDPQYLEWKLRSLKTSSRFIATAEDINTKMPNYVISRLLEFANKHHKVINGSKVLLLGAAYKQDIDDVRESPFFELWEQLEKLGAILCYHDPFAGEVKLNGKVTKSVPLTSANLKKFEFVVIVTAHSEIDYKFVVKNSKLIFDTRNATKNITCDLENKIELL